MEILLLIAIIAVTGGLLGGLIGIGLAKWPGQSTLGSAFRGVVIGISTLCALAFFVILVLHTVTGGFDNDPVRFHS
ncbi:MAG: hypothetical protein K8S13_24880 [Desulfobacula sp.]|uniref:hypothetical protein n=1 Tax=Desulfobacula sp. TaxID=2593537 RepID=UPI0025BFDE97|nr:hypothetical protein [Desulfobacula sp.]MCD4723066.1 hypothetical protein [Desulfobacula sp.]